MRSGKELLDLYKVLESESKEENGGHCTEEDNEDEWVEVQKLVSQSTLAKFIPKIPYS